MSLFVILPTYNEAQNLPGVIEALFALPIKDLSIVVVDDSSPDGTGVLAEELAQNHPGQMVVLHRPEKLGLGSAYLLGFEYALSEGAQAIAQMDSDFSHPPEKLVEMLDALEHFDVVLGSRYTLGGGVDRNWPLWRKGLSAFGNFYARKDTGSACSGCDWRLSHLAAGNIGKYAARKSTLNRIRIPG